MSDTPIYDDMVNQEPEQPSKTPQPKVVAATTGGAVGAAVSTVTVWIIEAVSGIDIPDTVEGACVVIFTAAVAFVAGYWTKN